MIELNLSARGTTRWLLIGLGLLLLCQLIIITGHFGFHRRMDAFTELFDLDRESNLPVFFNCLLFFFAAVLFRLHARMQPIGEARPWNIMAAVFLFLGIDEGSQVHEKFMLLTLRLMHYGDHGAESMGWLFYAWIIPYGLGGLALLIVLCPWLIRLERSLRNGLLLSGAIYVFGALVLEALSGKIAEPLQSQVENGRHLTWLPCEVYPFDQCHLYADAGYVTAYTIEEVVEMLGLILCTHVLLVALERKKVTFLTRMGTTAAA